jgi:ElaB/YqjD/DUF883 family membrane-anchored ribosome-binding protein
MNQRETRRDAMGAPSAGPANTPPFDRNTEIGVRASSQQKTETERELERTRDKVVEKAAPVMVEKAQEAAEETAPIIAEKAQEAMSETTQRMQGKEVKDQLNKTATAAKHDAQRMAKEKAQQALGQVEQKANQKMDQAAGKIDQAAHRLDHMADQKTRGATGAKAKAGRMAHTAADTMESMASYLRSNDVKDLQRNLEQQMRKSPLETLLVGVAAGWVVGKILR